MDLSKIIHTLDGVIIEEPIGFDSMKTTIKRGDYHGMSAEISVGTLEFHGIAAKMVREAYNTDIDTELKYQVTADGDIIYTGVLDLTTYDEHDGDYFTASCKVGEVGIKTTFNNRTETEIDLNTNATLDEQELAHKPTWKTLRIPAKTIKYKNVMEQPSTVEYSTNLAEDPLMLPDESERMFLGLTLANKKLNEFGSFDPMLYIGQMPDFTFDGLVEPLFDKGERFGDKFGENSTYTLDVDITIRMKFKNNIVTPRTDTPYFQMSFGIWEPNLVNGKVMSGTMRYISNDGGYYNYGSGSYNDRATKDCHEYLTYTLKGKLEGCSYERLYLGVYMYNSNDAWNDPAEFTVEIQKGSYVRMTLDSKKSTNVSADMLMIHEALNIITEAISNNELTVKSSLYNRCDSIVNALPVVNIQAGATQFGHGALKAITNGYKIRHLYSTHETNRNMPLSFKDAIKALDAIDCIGWGFSQEDGKLYIRIEKWDWFYKYIPIITINDPKEKMRKMDNNLVITELNIGYKKYMTAEDVSSIDSIHGERTFTSATKAISKQESVLCSFIADNYAIEETRRAYLNKSEDEEFKYDENIFVFALKASQYYNGGIDYEIPHDINSETNATFLSSGEMYNTVISPSRNAHRWISRLFCVNGLKPFALTKGTVNYTASFTTKQNIYETGYARRYYLTDKMNSIPMMGIMTKEDSWQEYQHAENTPLQERYYATYREQNDGTFKPIESAEDFVIPRVFKAEELSVKFPITLSQYKAIMANPYGIITVDGEQCWLKEMTYSFFKEEAEFKLIPKAN